MQPSEFVNPLKASNYCRSGNFRIRNVCAFNFRCVAKWQKLNADVRNYRTFNFRRLSNWRKSFHSENFPIYGKSSIEMCNVLFLLLTDTATFFIPFTYTPLVLYQKALYSRSCTVSCIYVWSRPALNKVPILLYFNFSVLL